MDLLPPVVPQSPSPQTSAGKVALAGESESASGFAALVADVAAESDEQVEPVLSVAEDVVDALTALLTEEDAQLEQGRSLPPEENILLDEGSLALVLSQVRAQEASADPARVVAVNEPVTADSEDSDDERELADGDGMPEASVVPAFVMPLTPEPLRSKPDTGLPSVATASGVANAVSEASTATDAIELSVGAESSPAESGEVAAGTEAFRQTMVTQSGRPAETGTLVKVETTVNHPVTDKGWPAAMGEHMVFLASQQLSSARLHLTPADMGPIAVEIRYEGSKVDVSFIAGHGQTRDVLQQAMPELKDAFSSQGMQLRADVSGGGQGQQAPTREEWLMEVAARNTVLADGNNDIEGLEQQARSLNSDSLLDFYA